MIGKKITSLYIYEDLLELAKDQNLNMSQLCNTLLIAYFYDIRKTAKKKSKVMKDKNILGVVKNE